jgi:peroxiredoxin
MSLNRELESFRTAWEARVGEAVARMIAGDIEELRTSGMLDEVARVGDTFPATMNLLDALGRRFDLRAALTSSPAIVTFYRGGWCPYCSLELRAYQRALPEITAAGGRLFAVSPERPDNALTTAEKNDLTFDVLSDVGGDLAAALGIRFTLSDTVRPFYEKAGHALPERNGDGSWALPMPATFVVEAGGRIAAAFVEPDYRKRLDPEDALAALRGLGARSAA